MANLHGAGINRRSWETLGIEKDLAGDAGLLTHGCILGAGMVRRCQDTATPEEPGGYDE